MSKFSLRAGLSLIALCLLMFVVAEAKRERNAPPAQPAAAHAGGWCCTVCGLCNSDALESCYQCTSFIWEAFGGYCDFVDYGANIKYCVGCGCGSEAVKLDGIDATAFSNASSVDYP